MQAPVNDDLESPDIPRGLEALIEGAQFPIVESNNEMIILHANAATHAVFGYSVDELVGQKVNILMMPNDSILGDDYIGTFNRTGVKNILKTVGRLVAGQRKDGTELALRLTTSATPNGFAAVFVDFTEQLAIRCSLAAER